MGNILGTIRAELTPLERREHLKRRKEIYEAKHPEAKAGVRRAYGMHRALGHDVDEIISPTFAEDTAAKLGVTPRTVQQDGKTQEEIAEAVGCQKSTVNEVICSVTENLPESNKAAANHLVDFEPPPSKGRNHARNTFTPGEVSKAGGPLLVLRERDRNKLPFLLRKRPPGRPGGCRCDCLHPGNERRTPL